MNAAKRELLRRRIERDTVSTAPDVFECAECGPVVHLPQPEDEAHCGCEDRDFGPIGCVCPCHWGLIDHSE
jgi:hypothetical protein